MSFVKFISRLFGPAAGPATAATPATRSMSGIGNARSSSASMAATAAQASFVRRQEILDARLRISGYRFQSLAMNGGVLRNTEQAVAALALDNLRQFALRRMAVLTLRIEEWLAHDYRQFVTPNTIFLVEMPGKSADLTSWLAGLQDLKTSGARIALDSVVLQAPYNQALAMADMLFIRLSDYAIEECERQIVSLRARYPLLTFAADDVHSWPEYRMCRAMGIDYCLGDFATTADAADTSETLSPSRLILIEMLNLLRGDADLATLAAVAKRDAGVVLKVIAMANSPLVGLSHPVGGIDQAIMMLGRESLYRWLAVAIFRVGTNRPQDQALLEIALCRARLLELLGAHLPKTEGDELFMVGLLSLLDSLLGQPMAQALSKISLPAAVANVLLEHRGPYSAYLNLALALEKGRSEPAARLAGALALDPETIAESNSAALRWAEEAMAAG
jgi:EAL and modified HD-GYP domain-containing signal transduction protein